MTPNASEPNNSTYIGILKPAIRSAFSQKNPRSSSPLPMARRSADMLSEATIDLADWMGRADSRRRNQTSLFDGLWLRFSRFQNLARCSL